MSISLILAQTTQPNEGAGTLIQFAGMAVWLVAALVTAWRLGAVGFAAADGPLRVPRNVPVWPIALVFGAGLFIWFGSQIGYASYLQVQAVRAGKPAPMRAEDFSPTHLSILATVPGVITFLVLLLGDLLCDGRTLDWLGVGGRHVPRGVWRGFLAFLVIAPVMWWVLVAMQWIYTQIHFQHPAEHDLLRVMKVPSQLVKFLSIAGAVVVAPIFEEYLFRGHLQTLIRQFFYRATYPLVASPYAVIPVAEPGQGFPVQIATPGQIGTPSDPTQSAFVPPPPPTEPTLPAPAVQPERQPGGWQSWIAILITSLLFAGVHPLWTFPAIFLLSILLGYVYERTGNLWVNITVHALFNGASTLMYLLNQPN